MMQISLLQKIQALSQRQIIGTGQMTGPGFWLGLWALGMACAWVLPNHYLPWRAFHADAWSAMMLALLAAGGLWRSGAPVQWHGVALLVALLACVPWLQYGAGMMAFAGQAWITTAYLLGLLMALLTGQRWERMTPGRLAGALFLAIGIASIVSVNLQLRTWLYVMDAGVMDIWSMGFVGERPYANLGQPNQLATLLLWGLLASAWGYANQKIRGSVAGLLAAFLLFGIALTQSRTAWLGLSLLLLAAWVWRPLWRSPAAPYVVTALFAFFWVCPLLVKGLAEALLLNTERQVFREVMQAEQRPLAWRLFVSAALERPWFGYGWSEVTHAQLAVAQNFPSLNSTFGHAHNLFLDLVLWLGMPLGLFVSAVLVRRFVAFARSITKANDAILMMFLAVIGIHAMLELPLHYAYFLLPTGLVIGVLSQCMQAETRWQTPRWTLLVLWLAGTVLLALVVRDYFRVEASFQAMRFEKARIGTLPVGKPPDVVLLTQLREAINMLREEPRPGMSAEQVKTLVQAVNIYASVGTLYKAASTLAMNGQPDEARQWLAKICKISDETVCAVVKRAWAEDGRGNALLAAVPWPQ